MSCMIASWQVASQSTQLKQSNLRRTHSSYTQLSAQTGHGLRLQRYLQEWEVKRSSGRGESTGVTWGGNCHPKNSLATPAASPVCRFEYKEKLRLIRHLQERISDIPMQVNAALDDSNHPPFSAESDVLRE